jgi:outer membrane protein assembly factor BamB
VSLARRSAAVALALVAGALGAGCEELQGSAHPEVPLWVHHPGGSLSIFVRRTLTNPDRVKGENYERGRPALDPANLRVFVGSADHGLYAVQAPDGAPLWRFETLGPVQSEPLYDPGEDVVYFGSTDGALYKVRAQDGTLLWRFASNAEVSERPVLRDGVVYATNANDTLLSIDAATGKLRWYQRREPQFGIEIGGHAGAAVAHGLVYTAFSDGTVMAYDAADGAERWPLVDLAADAAEAADGEPPQYLDVDTTPIPARIASGDVVFVASYAGGVVALDAASGRRAWINDHARGVTELVLWEQPAHPPIGQGAPPPGTPEVLAERRARALPQVPARRVLLASSGQTGIWGLDPETGEALWRRELPEGGVTAPAPVAGAFLVGTTRYGLFLLSPLDGGVIDGIEPGNEFAMTPATDGFRAFVMTNGGQLLGVHVQPPPGWTPPKKKDG